MKEPDDRISTGPCQEQPVSTAFDQPSLILQAKLGLYEALDRHILSLRHLQILRVIRARSFDRGQTRAFVPALSFFGMDKADASVAIDELVAWHVIEAPARPEGRRGDGRRFPRPEGGHYAINVFWRSWGAPERRSSAWDEQLWLPVEEPTLEEGLRRSFFEFDLSVPHRGPRSKDLSDVTGASPDGRDVVQLAGATAGEGVGSADSPPSDSGSAASHNGRPEAGVRPGRDSVASHITVGDLPTLPESQEGALRDHAYPPTLAPNGGAGLTVGGLASAVPLPTKNGAPAAAAAVSPHTPLVQKTVQRTVTVPKTVNGETRSEGSLNATVHARARGTVGEIPTHPLVSWAEQRELEDELRAVIPSDMRPDRSRTFWLTRAIRNFPDAVKEALGEMRYKDETERGYFAGEEHRARWLTIVTARYAGVKSWKQIRPGLEPIK